MIRGEWKRPTLIWAIVVGLAMLRLAHIHLLWSDEDYHLAAAIHMLHGKALYRDFWYDKPPLDALYYLLIGVYSGWPLRLLDTAYVLVACGVAYKIAALWWSNVEGYWAAFCLAFFSVFYLPSAVIPFAADALMTVPHLAAIYYALRRRPSWAGVWAGVAFLFNVKAAFVLVTCASWLWPDLLMVAVGFAAPCLLAVIAGVASGSLTGYYEQVWQWGMLYAKGSPTADPLRLGLSRTAGWLGFHSALAVSATYALKRVSNSDRFKLGVWLILSFAGVCLGTRFATHYYVQLLPPAVIAASRGIVLALRRFRTPAVVCLGLLLAVPFVRFAPRYFTLMADNIQGRQPRWADVQLDLDSQQAARRVLGLAHPGDTLFVWGYRPNIYVYTRMTSDGRFWDSQPLTGVPADRHITATSVIFSGPAAANRNELTRSHPTFIVDGLGLLNPRLAPDVYPEVREWLSHYRQVAKTNLSVIYRKSDY